MRKMSYLFIAIMALITIGALSVGCQSCYRGANVENDFRKSKTVPTAIAEAKLLSYNYTLNGTIRYPLLSESVELCEDDSTRCIIRIFNESRVTDKNFDADGEPVPDTLIASSEVLDSIKQMIVDAKAWRFKDSYSPRVKTLDGYSWSYSALFAVTDSMLAVTPEAKRARLLRNGGCRLSSGGENASPDTQLFEQINLYLQSLYDSAISQ